MWLAATLPIGSESGGWSVHSRTVAHRRSVPAITALHDCSEAGPE